MIDFRGDREVDWLVALCVNDCTSDLYLPVTHISDDVVYVLVASQKLLLLIFLLVMYCEHQ